METNLLSVRGLDLFTANEIIWTELKTLDPQINAVPNPPWQGAGLQSLVFFDWKERVLAVERGLPKRNPVLRTLLLAPAYKELLAAVSDRGRKNGGSYADPRAPLWLLDATLFALQARAIYVENKSLPRIPGKKDWDEAELAIQTLIKLKHLGIRLDPKPVQAPLAWLPFDWLERLAGEIKSNRVDAPKPHIDSTAIAREACRVFAQRIYIHFSHDVAVAVLRNFGDLIEYSSDKLSSVYLKKWLAEFNSDTSSDGLDTDTFTPK